MSPAGFEPTMPASERLQSQALGRAATGDRRKENLLDIDYVR
jgi:hypothetical protein